MSDLIHRSQKAKVLVADPSLPKWQRLYRGLEAFSGLELSLLEDDVARHFEADLVRINQVLARYQPSTSEDYQSIADDDLEDMLDTVDTAAEQAIVGELDRIVADLDERKDKLPEEAIQEARQHRELMIPRLIEELRMATSAARQGAPPKGNAHFFAIFLLTEFEAEEAFPAILEAFSLPGELPFDLFGDAVTSALARILARFAADRPQVVDTLIRDSDLNEYVRWEAAQCYVHFVRDGHLTRDEAVERLGQHLRWAVGEKDVAVISCLISELAAFAPQEALADITQAYQLGLVDAFLIDLETVKSRCAEGEELVHEELARCPETGIKDTIEELRRWTSFREKPVARPSPPKPHLDAPWATDKPVSVSVMSRGSRVGRNDPCPCGSGKKFKKCCRSRTQQE